jgi:Fe-S cluster biogenesis protein NfuA
MRKSIGGPGQREHSRKFPFAKVVGSGINFSTVPTQTSSSNGASPSPAAGGKSARERVERVLSLIRPAVQADGGDIEFLGITPAGVVQIRLHGACVGCPSSTITLQMGIERNLKEHVPEVSRVEAVA